MPRSERPRRRLSYAVAGGLIVAVIVVAAAVATGVVRSRNRSETAPNEPVSALAGMTGGWCIRRNRRVHRDDRAGVRRM